MNRYIGTKIIEAMPSTRNDFARSRGNPIMEDPDTDGYMVKYPDGYVIWSPKAQFEEAYRMTDGLTFGLAIEALRKGHRVARSGWNGKGMWLTLSPGGHVPSHGLWAPNNREFAESRADKHATVLPYITMKTADDKIVPWLASQTDMLAFDWVLLP